MPGCLSARLLSQPSWWQKITSMFFGLETTKDWAAFKVILPRMTRLKDLHLNLFFNNEVNEALNLDGVIKQKLESLTISITSRPYCADRLPEVMQLWDQVSHLTLFSYELAVVDESYFSGYLSQIPTTWQLQSVSVTGFHSPFESHSLLESAFTPLRNITSLIVWSRLLEKIGFAELVPLLPLIEVFKSIEFRTDDLFGPRFIAECIRSGSYAYWETDVSALFGWKRLRECIFSFRLFEDEMPDPESVDLPMIEDDFSSYFRDYSNKASLYDRYRDPITYLEVFAKLNDECDEEDMLLPPFSIRCKRELTQLERLEIYGFNDDVQHPKHYAPIFIALRCGMGELHCFYR